MNDNESKLIALTDEEIDAFDTAELRARATELLSSYYLWNQVASVELDDDLADYSGALTAIDKLFAALKAVYKGREPRVHKYGGSIVLSILHTDTYLRQELKDRRRYAIKRAEESE
jgi:hypothetical protein